MKLKFLIIGDLHGAMPRISTKDFDAIIAPGDFCSDKGIREAYMKLYNKYIQNVKDKKGVDWWDVVGKKKAKKMTYYSLNRGRKILEYLNAFDKPVFLVPGNWDWTESSEEEWEFLNKDFWNTTLIKGLKNICDVDKSIIKFHDVQFLGYGRCNGPELIKYRGYKGFKKKDFERNKKRFQKTFAKYDRLFVKAKKSKLPIIFINHNVPYNTKLDTIVNKKSPLNGKHYGSILARRLIDKHQPLVSIGGHMHEHFGKDMIKKTTAINSGFGRDVNTILEITDGKITKLKFLK